MRGFLRRKRLIGELFFSLLACGQIANRCDAARRLVGSDEPHPGGPGLVGVRHHPLQARGAEDQLDAPSVPSQTFGHSDRCGTLVLPKREDDVVDPGRKLQQEILVGEQFHQDDVPHAEADGRQRGSAQAFEEPVVAPATADRAKLCLAVEGLEDDPRVVGEASDDRRVERDVLADAVRVEQLEEPFETKQIGSSAMPWKLNPMRCERIGALSRHVIALLDDTAQTSANQWLQHLMFLLLLVNARMGCVWFSLQQTCAERKRMKKKEKERKM